MDNKYLNLLYPLSSNYVHLHFKIGENIYLNKYYNSSFEIRHCSVVLFLSSLLSMIGTIEKHGGSVSCTKYRHNRNMHVISNMVLLLHIN